MNDQSNNFEKEFEFPEFSVILTQNTIIFKKYSGENDKDGKKIFVITMLFSNFKNKIDPPEIGGKIEINFYDRWGSSMQFIHYSPSDLKGVFEFIARGYKIDLSEKKDFIMQNSIPANELSECQMCLMLAGRTIEVTMNPPSGVVNTWVLDKLAHFSFENATYSLKSSIHNYIIPMKTIRELVKYGISTDIENNVEHKLLP